MNHRGSKLARNIEYAMSIEQIARELGVTGRCVEKSLRSALAKLEPLLAEWRDHEPARVPIPGMFVPLGRRVRG